MMQEGVAWRWMLGIEALPAVVYSVIKFLDYRKVHVGRRGGSFIFRNGELFHIEAEKVTVVDAVGAGDDFSAAFVCTYSKLKDPVRSAEIANKVGAFVASRERAIPEYDSTIKGLFEYVRQFSNY